MTKKQKVLAMIGGLVAYCVIGGALAFWLQDKLPVFFIAIINYGVATMIFGPLLPFVFDNRKETTSE